VDQYFPGFGYSNLTCRTTYNRLANRLQQQSFLSFAPAVGHLAKCYITLKTKSKTVLLHLVKIIS